MSSTATKESTTWLTIKSAASAVWLMFVGVTTFCVLFCGGVWVFANGMRWLTYFLFH